MASQPLSAASLNDLIHAGLGRAPGLEQEFTERLPGQLQSDPSVEPQAGSAGQSQRLAAPAWVAGLRPGHSGAQPGPGQRPGDFSSKQVCSVARAWHWHEAPWAWSWRLTQKLRSTLPPATPPAVIPPGPCAPRSLHKTSRGKNQTSTFVSGASCFVGVCPPNKRGHSAFQRGQARLCLRTWGHSGSLDK